jgi:hypothetical protein
VTEATFAIEEAIRTGKTVTMNAAQTNNAAGP